MGRKSKYSAMEKLKIINEAKLFGDSAAAKAYYINKKTIWRWRLLYQYQGLAGLNPLHRNQSYSKELKIQLVKQYQQSNDSMEEFAIKHGLRGHKQLSDWINQYNGSNLRAYTPRKRDSKMTGRKTTFEERITIIEELIKHDLNYNWAVEHYNVSYQQVYGWYRKYKQSGNNPESLRDRRGKAKPKSEWTEVDRLKAENRLLKAKLKQQEIEIAFAKKLVEIRNREAKKRTNTKQFKK
ncbi:helix-turn-helix domain-containing protein [[Lactobacillus] timonensis]|jgi:transposase-like protein|uniref:helix-turn-helix domain-containing protein n=1 Tax=[Lactobacillus] timonensis TaxID=1970790 RepID=UPI000C8170DE|nr:helix-turn-helix domain-containing protein [[Lactobacillus] timonensis]